MSLGDGVGSDVSGGDGGFDDAVPPRERRSAQHVTDVGMSIEH